MTNYLTRAPHSDPSSGGGFVAPNAALLIDFDNVTMGMRSDLAKELKSLLDSDIIKGKVTVQRAYADWLRYPQYIVPLSEASIDLIFAPAYGSSKKNATDIRMAIDGMELVFIRPEIGTYILLTGDSDFSSLVLKLKEYGKYVIGIGIQESSSDILVQNCDEYYSYTALSGLRKTTDQDSQALDPWECVEEAVKRMTDRGDVMRSDRLKQVMLELSPTFDERNLGFRKFSKFLVDAAGKGLITLQRGENGQYEVGVASKGGTGAQSGGGNSRGRGGRGRGRGNSSAGAASDGGKRDADRSRGGDRKGSGAEKGQGGEAERPEATADVASALTLLGEAMEALAGEGRGQAMDSDVKRRLLSMNRSFDEGELGFGKFSQFLAHAEERGVVSLKKLDTGNYEVSAAGGSAEAGPSTEPSRTSSAPAETQKATPSTPTPSTPMPAPETSAPVARSQTPAPQDDTESRGVLGLRGLLGRLGPRRGERTARRPASEVVQIPPEQTRVPPTSRPDADRTSSVTQSPAATTSAKEDAPSSDGEGTAAPASGSTGSVDLRELGLPSSAEAMTSYLANRYRGVGQKTAETLVASLGTDLFDVLQNQPERIKGLVGESRAEQVLTAWREDYRRRVERAAARAPAG
jgi:uncharacterized protein (TIGR00288 family)